MIRDPINPGSPIPHGTRRKPPPMPQELCGNCLFASDCGFPTKVSWCAEHKFADASHRRRAEYEATRRIER